MKPSERLTEAKRYQTEVAVLDHVMRKANIPVDDFIAHKVVGGHWWLKFKGRLWVRACDLLKPENKEDIDILHEVNQILDGETPALLRRQAD